MPRIQAGQHEPRAAHEYGVEVVPHSDGAELLVELRRPPDGRQVLITLHLSRIDHQAPLSVRPDQFHPAERLQELPGNVEDGKSIATELCHPQADINRPLSMPTEARQLVSDTGRQLVQPVRGSHHRSFICRHLIFR